METAGCERNANDEKGQAWTMAGHFAFFTTAFGTDHLRMRASVYLTTEISRHRTRMRQTRIGAMADSLRMN